MRVRVKTPATHRAATKLACDTSPCPTSPTELACYRASAARPNASPCSSERTPSIKLLSHVMPAAQPASSNRPAADVEAYHHRGPRPNLLACQSSQRGLRAGSRGPLNENDFGPTFVRHVHHESIEDSESLSSHHTILRHSDISHFDLVLSSFLSLGTTRTRFVFFRYPPCLAAHSHMPSLASSLLRRFHKRARASYAHAMLGRDSIRQQWRPACFAQFTDNGSVLDLDLRLSVS